MRPTNMKRVQRAKKEINILEKRPKSMQRDVIREKRPAYIK